MSTQDSGKETFKVLFSRALDYRVIPATGAWGGLSPNGEIVFDLYVEKRQNPEKMEIEAEKGVPTREKRHPDPQPLVRESQIGIVLRPDIAKSIGEFLVGLADKAIVKKEGTEE